MIPKTNALILGILCEQPLSPYEMIKYFENVNLKYWFPVSDPTFYSVIKKLSREGMVIGSAIKQGNNPEKTVYSITPQGREKVIATFLEFLVSAEIDPVMFQITVIFLHHIEREVVLTSLEKRIEIIQKKMTGASMRYERIQQNQLLPYNACIVTRYALYAFESEIRITQELLEFVREDKTWSPIPMSEAFSSREKKAALKVK